jgi:hypothetical protein
LSREIWHELWKDLVLYENLDIVIFVLFYSLKKCFIFPFMKPSYKGMPILNSNSVAQSIKNVKIISLDIMIKIRTSTSPIMHVNL